MSSTNDDDSHQNDIYSPSDIDKEQLTWDGNDAKIPGLLFEVSKHLIRNALLQPFLRHRAVLVSNGKTAVPSLQTVSFVQGTIKDYMQCEAPSAGSGR